MTADKQKGKRLSTAHTHTHREKNILCSMESQREGGRRSEGGLSLILREEEQEQNLDNQEKIERQNKKQKKCFHTISICCSLPMLKFSSIV